MKKANSMNLWKLIIVFARNLLQLILNDCNYNRIQTDANDIWTQRRIDWTWNQKFPIKTGNHFYNNKQAHFWRSLFVPEICAVTFFYSSFVNSFCVFARIPHLECNNLFTKNIISSFHFSFTNHSHIKGNCFFLINFFFLDNQNCNLRLVHFSFRLFWLRILTISSLMLTLDMGKLFDKQKIFIFQSQFSVVVACGCCLSYIHIYNSRFFFWRVIICVHNSIYRFAVDFILLSQSCVFYCS